MKNYIVQLQHDTEMLILQVTATGKKQAKEIVLKCENAPAHAIKYIREVTKKELNRITNEILNI